MQVNKRTKTERPIRVVVVLPLHDGTQPSGDICNDPPFFNARTDIQGPPTVRSWPLFQFWDNFSWQGCDRAATDVLNTKVQSGEIASQRSIEHNWVQPKTGALVAETYIYDLVEMTSKQTAKSNNGVVHDANTRALRTVLLLTFR